MKLTNSAANAAVNAHTTLLNGGKLRIYSGTQPATADDALSGNTLLAEIGIPNPAFGNAVAGVATANGLTADASADNSGTATFYRCVQSDGATNVHDGTVSAVGGGGELQLNSTSIGAGANVSVSSWTITQPKA